jgi:alkanesulfonate monooxygenase SsuD/methylene tetrahydromethanopterin reductase-like flavin-dependent oxidoreductase (luciferase family)
MRFDMRAPPEGPAALGDLYGAALEMAAWSEAHGCIAVQVSEHHASPDGYLPAPLVLASAIAARTRSLPIQIAALVLPLHDPIALAERMAVLDAISGGRVSYVLALGYRPEEYAMFGRDFRGRGRRMDACVEALQRALSGEPFEFEGRPVHVTPAPAAAGRPLLILGGGSKAAVRRAARFGLGMITQGGDPSLEALYREACEEAGTTPGMFIDPPAGSVMSGFVAEDPDRAWSELGPFMLHDARMYAAWLGAARSATLSNADSVEALRAEGGAYRIFTPEEAVEHIRTAGVFLTQPLCGGLPPDLAWPSLELLASKVLPAVGAGTEGVSA